MANSTMRAIFFFLLLASPLLLQVVRCESDSSHVEATADVDESGEGFDIGEGDSVINYDGEDSFPAAPGVETVCVFPKNSGKLVPAGEESTLLVGVNNGAESALNVLAVKASIHLPFDHHMLVQNLTIQGFRNSSVPVSAQATFPYIFVAHKYLQPGTFDLVGTIIYEIDQVPHQTTFYNGTIEVVEASSFLSIESVFLVTLGIALLTLGGMWVYGQIQRLSKKTKKSPKVEVGTKTVDASMDEWLEGTAYAQSQSTKTKKKK